MKVVGLTGGIGMGKTAADKLLRERGVPVVDTDLLAREIVEPGQSALADVKEAFGQEIVGSDGRLQRDKLARQVFADPAARKRLEQILHPRIRARWRHQVEAWNSEGRPLAVVVIPLLFETNAQAELDATLCVACSAATQRERLLARGWSNDEIEQRIQSQWPADRKMVLADYVLWTEGGFEVLVGQLDRILKCIEPQPSSGTTRTYED